MCQSDEQEMYLMSAKMLSHKHKIVKAIEILQAALNSSKNAALSFSGGKDSVVLLDLAVKSGFNGTIVFFKYGICTDVETPSENVELLKYYADKYQLKYKILECLGEADCWEKCGRFTLYPQSENEKRIFYQTNYDFIKKSAQFEEENDIDLGIIGMRKDESKRRKIILNRNGATYKAKGRKSITCCPLLNFSNDDIWAYIFSNNLKYLSIYDYPYIDRRVNRNEITMLYNDAIIRNGQIFHYQKMYPDFFAWLKNRWGDNLF